MGVDYYIYRDVKEEYLCCTKGETVSTPLDKDGIHKYWLRHCCLSALNHIFF